LDARAEQKVAAPTGSAAGEPRYAQGEVSGGASMKDQRVALVATMRNEGPFVLEWLAYHRAIGFTDVIVCTNDCVDGSPDLLDALQARGALRHLRCHPAADDKAQLFAYAQAEAALAHDWPDVTMVLDADEFLNIHVGAGRVTDLLDAVPDATTFLVNWRIFGASGQEHWSTEPVLERFTRAADRDHGVNWSFKTLFRHADAYHCPLLPHGPGFAKPERLAGLCPVDGGGNALPEQYARAESFLQSAPGTVSYALAQVNHYNTRSWEDYLAKHARGGGLGPERWARDENWAIFNRNEAEDLSIQRHLPAVRAGVAELLGDDRVAAAYQRCCTLYDAHVAELARTPA
jgi:hypothetical protein